MGFLIGERFSSVIRSRVDKDLILQEQLLPFASTDEGTSLVEALERSNKERYPRYWDELVGTASGSGVPLLHVHLYPLLLISFFNLTFRLEKNDNFIHVIYQLRIALFKYLSKCEHG